jgi:hypothetical protein
MESIAIWAMPTNSDDYTLIFACQLPPDNYFHYFAEN